MCAVLFKWESPLLAHPCVPSPPPPFLRFNKKCQKQFDDGMWADFFPSPPPLAGERRSEYDPLRLSRLLPLKLSDFAKSAKNNFDNVYDSRSYYIRWDSDIHRLQSAKINKGNKQPSFVVPNQWYNSYNSIETGRSSGPKVLDEMKIQDCRRPSHPSLHDVPHLGILFPIKMEK